MFEEHALVYELKRLIGQGQAGRRPTRASVLAATGLGELAAARRAQDALSSLLSVMARDHPKIWPPSPVSGTVLRATLVTREPPLLPHPTGAVRRWMRERKRKTMVRKRLWLL